MNKLFQQVIKESTGADEIYEIEVIQNLWSGYGKIIRFGLRIAQSKSVVVKHVRLPKGDNHPRGWNTDLSHERKLKSYRVETAWYQQWSNKCNEMCRIPHCLAVATEGDEVLMVLEDIDDSGFPERKTTVTQQEINACLKWLANFHAVFLGEKPSGLWETGTYWHLETRPDELKVLDDVSLKNAAEQIDKEL
ncbi:MAG: ecdysteroid 22-kinase family protein, partial [Bacteroidales bacterium]|nr:ecdysteroid 22-kinase family protein [Bacteroidales bacterium]